MLLDECAGDQSLSPGIDGMGRRRSVRELLAGMTLAGPKGAPPTIPPIIINPVRYEVPGPAIDPRKPPPHPPVTPPARPSMSLLPA